MLGRALAGVPRDSYALVGHDRARFLQRPARRLEGLSRASRTRNCAARGDYADYVRMATEKSLARCGVDKFDCLMLHNPDSIGYTSDAVWKAMDKVKEAKLTDRSASRPGRRMASRSTSF